MVILWGCGYCYLLGDFFYLFSFCVDCDCFLLLRVLWFRGLEIFLGWVLGGWEGGGDGVFWF